MAYVPNYAYDIFISYARIDDEVDYPGGTKWVSTFEEYLSIALRKRLGGTTDVKIFFDRRTLNSNDELRELEQAAERSALFLAVCSRSYVDREWTTRELSAFSRQPDIAKRVFAIEIMPLDNQQSYPALLADRHREPFYVHTPHSRGTAVSLAPDDPRFGHLIHDLAEQVRNQMYAMRAVSEVKTAAASVTLAEPRQPAPESLGGSGAVVALGQTTEDLDAAREQMRRYLEQFGHTVLPKGDLRQDKEGFEADVRAMLDDADLFVQILGPLRGRSAPGIQRSYAQTQADLAREANVPVLQWRSAQIRIDEIEDVNHRETLTSEDVVVSGFENFKAEVNGRLAAMTIRPEAPEPDSHDQSLPVVFINADRSDLEYARKVQDEFVRNGFLAAIPLDRGDEQDLQSYLRDNLLDCDGLVMIYGNASPVWASRSLRHFNKLRASRDLPPKLVAVVVGPPDSKTSDLGISMPGLRVVGSPDAWRQEAIDGLIEALSA